MKGGLIGSPMRNLLSILIFLLVVIVCTTVAYMEAGWRLADAFYMVVLTIFTVGYGEVHPLNTVYLRTVTEGLMFLGCTGMILMTGALVQMFTASEIRNLLGTNRVKSDIERLKDHVIICGYGRIGAMLAHELTAAGAAFVIMERDDKRVEEAKRAGYLCMQGDASDEANLSEAGILKARALAAVLPNDAANVFITLSARNMNSELQIIARGEATSTERKLLHAGADKVIMPTHIGAERMAELILFPATANFVRNSEQGRGVERTLRTFGLEIEVVAAGKESGIAGLSVEALERRAAGAFFVAQIDRPGIDPIIGPSGEAVIQAGDGLVVVGRSIEALQAALTKIAASASNMQTGRMRGRT
jgi:voltage-gated potassium channel